MLSVSTRWAPPVSANCYSPSPVNALSTLSGLQHELLPDALCAPSLQLLNTAASPPPWLAGFPPQSHGPSSPAAAAPEAESEALLPHAFQRWGRHRLPLSIRSCQSSNCPPSSPVAAYVVVALHLDLAPPTGRAGFGAASQSELPASPQSRYSLRRLSRSSECLDHGMTTT
jgi:hypothetical protein